MPLTIKNKNPELIIIKFKAYCFELVLQVGILVEYAVGKIFFR
jgi:hypothetical protein